MPAPRNSIRPASAAAGRTRSLPPTASRWTRSSPTSRAKRRRPARAASMSSSASRDLPAPEGPRINTARAPTSTAEACRVADVIPSSPPRRETVGTMPASHRRQAHDKARTENFRRAVRPDRAGAVLDPDRAAMGFDDLLRDRQAKPGILTEPLVRAIGVETLEYLFAHIVAHARTVVIDKNLKLMAKPPTRDAHRRAGR